MNIRLERRIELDGKEIYVEIYLQDKEGYIGLIGLKYKTKSVEIVVNDERFKLKDQAAQDISRYKLNWRNYSNSGVKNGIFRYLFIKIEQGNK